MLSYRNNCSESNNKVKKWSPLDGYAQGMQETGSCWFLFLFVAVFFFWGGGVVAFFFFLVLSFLTSYKKKNSATRRLDSEQSLFCSKIPAGGAARKWVRYSSGERRSRELRVAWVGE